MADLKNRGLLNRAYFQTYDPEVIKELDRIQNEGETLEPRAKYVFMGLPTGEVAEILQHPKNRGSKIGVSAAIFNKLTAAGIHALYPRLGIHVNLTDTPNRMSRVLENRPDTVMTSTYDTIYP